MGFELNFAPHRFDGTTKQGINPYTKQPTAYLNNEAISREEADAVVRVLKRSGADGPDDRGRYRLQLDGGTVRVYTSGEIEHGCMFSIEDIDPDIPPALAQLLFDVMAAGNWVITEIGEKDEVLAVSPDCVRGTAGSFGPVVVVDSPRDVAMILSRGLDAWREAKHDGT